MAEEKFKIARIQRPDGTLEDLRFPADADDALMTEAVNLHMQQFMPSDSPLGLRMKAKFAQNQEDELKVLKNHYGDENVRIGDAGKLEFRERADQFFKPVNPVGFDLGDLAEMAPDAPEMVLGTLGSIGGAALGNLPGAMLGGAAGGVLGRGTKMAMGDMMGVPQPDAASNFMGAAAVGSAGELAGRAAFGLGSRIFAPFKKTITPEAQAATDWMNKYIPLPTDLKSKTLSAIGADKFRLLPAESTESRGLDFLHNIAENSIFGGSSIATFKANRDKAIKLWADDLANQFGTGLDPQTIGTVAANTITGNYNAVHAPAQAMLNAVEKKVGHVPISIKDIKRGLKPQAKTIEEINGFEGRHGGDDIVAAINGLADNIPFTAAKELRSRLIARADEYNIANTHAPAKGMAQRMIGELNTAIENSLEKVAPEQYIEWRVANSFYRNGEHQFNGRFARSLIKMANPDKGGNPEGIVGAIFKNQKPSVVEMSKKFLDPASFRQLTGYMLHDKMIKATSAEGVLDAEKLIASTIGPKGLGEKTMKIALGDNYEPFVGMLNSLKLGQAGQSTGTGTMFIQLAQAGALVATASAVGGLVGGGEGALQAGSGTGVAVIAIPYATAKLMTTRLGMRLLSEGFRLPKEAWASKGAGIIGRIMALQSQLADVESLDDLEAEEKTTIGELPTKKFPPLGPPSPFSSVAGQPQ